jgi:hypothetical protein
MIRNHLGNGPLEVYVSFKIRNGPAFPVKNGPGVYA